MDTALQLLIAKDRAESISPTQIQQSLAQSTLVQQLTRTLPEKPLGLIWRLIAMSEIPFAYRLSYTKKLIDRVLEELGMEAGFSLSGDKKQFLPCYNAMVIQALCRLGQTDEAHVQNGLKWINQHQPIQRGKTVEVAGFRFDRYRGCFRSTPCYIGLVKSVFALHTYQRASGDKRYAAKLQAGIDYMLAHRMYRRLSSEQPITKHITDLAFPATYHLNIVELIRFVYSAGLIDHPQVQPLRELLLAMQKANGDWKIDFRYQSEDYHTFDAGKGKHEWLSYHLRSVLGLRA